MHILYGVDGWRSSPLSGFCVFKYSTKKQEGHVPLQKTILQNCLFHTKEILDGFIP